ncbi:MAG TPA: NAD(P)/FAD-dependent oxidoreductase, partial [Sulfuricurvum sp.]|nr:NAD(P)/FAD-dependent oxidoreductase [Sulfuricurvum sp.]
MQTHIVIIGGGYGGLRAIEHLAARSDIRITLLDRNPYHYLQTEAYGYIAGRFDIHDIAIDLDNWCRGFGQNITFTQCEVSRIDMDGRRVETSAGGIEYDQLIIATGARTNFFAFIKGLRENSYGVKNMMRAFNFRREFERLIFEKVN